MHSQYITRQDLNQGLSDTKLQLLEKHVSRDGFRKTEELNGDWCPKPGPPSHSCSRVWQVFATGARGEEGRGKEKWSKFFLKLNFFSLFLFILIFYLVSCSFVKSNNDVSFKKLNPCIYVCMHEWVYLFLFGSLGVHNKFNISNLTSLLGICFSPLFSSSLHSLYSFPSSHLVSSLLSSALFFALIWSFLMYPHFLYY